MGEPNRAGRAGSADTREKTRKELRKIGRYRIIAELGAGGMAEVYLAVTLGQQFNKLVVLKVPRIGPFESPGLRAMFVDEARVAARLNHPNVVQTYEVVRDDDRDVIVMEYLDGYPLSRIISQGRRMGMPLPLWMHCEVLVHAMTGLHHAHETRDFDGVPLNLVHRDVSPQNIFVTFDRQVKLLDFGIAKARTSTHETEVGTIKGKVRYMAAEQIVGLDVDRRADIFALGISIWEAAVGTSLWGGRPDVEVIGAVLSGDIPMPREVRSDVPEAIDAICRKALARRREDRYATCLELQADLEAYLASLPDEKGLKPIVAYMETLFAGPRAERQASIERELARAELSTTGEYELLDASPDGALADDAPPLARAPRDSDSSAIRSAPDGRLPERRTPARAPRSGGRKHLLAIGAGAAIGVAGASVLFAFAGARHVFRSDHSSAPPPSAPPALAVAIEKPEPKCPDEMATIPAGQFFMGSDAKDAQPNAKPSHHVKLDAFCMDRYEVTAKDYKSCSDIGGCRRAPVQVEWPGMTAAEQKLYSTLCTISDPAKHDHPINCVTWEMASDYCKAQDKKLPTEAEWEYTARGPDGRIYPWGDEAPTADHLNACGAECVAWGRMHGVSLEPLYGASDGYPTTAPVGKFPAGKSRFGTFDVAGNVWEWTADWYGDYRAEDVENPAGPATGEKRIIRGGGFNGSFASWLLPSFRYAQDPKAQSHGIGFRCAKPLTAPPK